MLFSNKNTLFSKNDLQGLFALTFLFIQMGFEVASIK